MSLADDDSLIGVVALPVLGGIVGGLFFGPLGFFTGLTLLLVLGAYMQDRAAKKDERIDELEVRVEELEDDVE